MFLPLVALVALHGHGQDPVNPFEGVQVRQDTLTSTDGKLSNLVVQQPQGPLPTPKIAPKAFGVNGVKFEFDWITWGYAHALSSRDIDLRFRVYSQNRLPENDPALAATRMLLRLWDLNAERLGVDHPAGSYHQLVNVYLTYGGKAGGEQFVSADVEGKRQIKISNIFIYDIPSFTQPIEMARELAHEYGHATLPAVGVYDAPEDWANGYLGEKLYMAWIRDILAAKTLTPDDFMGANLDDFNKWVGANVEPVVNKVASTKPTMGDLARRSAAGMDSFTGLGTYMGLILPNKVFSRSLMLIGSQNARDYLAAIGLALDEAPEVPLTIPTWLQGKKIWIPIGKATVSGAKVDKLAEGWAQIEATTAPVIIKRKR